VYTTHCRAGDDPPLYPRADILAAHFIPKSKQLLLSQLQGCSGSNV